MQWSNSPVDKGLFRWITLHFGSLLFSPVEEPQMRVEWENVCSILQWMAWRFTSKVFVSRVPVALFTSSSPINNNINNHHDYCYYHHYIIGSVHFPLTYLLPVGFLQLGKKGCHKPENCWKRYEVWLWIVNPFLKRVILAGKNTWSLCWDVVYLNPNFLFRGRSLSSILSCR